MSICSTWNRVKTIHCFYQWLLPVFTVTVLSPFHKAELRVLNFEWQQIDYKGGCGRLIEVAS